MKTPIKILIVAALAVTVVAAVALKQGKNESKDAVTIDSSFFKLLAADGSTYETDSDNLMYLPADKNFFLAKINPNLSKSGQVLFAVSAGAKPQDFKLQVQTGAFGTQTGEIALTK